MLKKITCVILALMLFLSGCGKPETPESKGFPFRDDLNREVTVSNPRRAACLLGSFADVWIQAGGAPIAAPDDAWEDLKLPMPETAKNLGGTKSISLELLLEVNPDFVIASAKTKINLEFRETLEQAGIPVAYFDVANFKDYLRMLRICTGITGREDLYEKNGLSVQKIIDDTVARSKERVAKHGAPRVLCMRASASSLRAKNSQGNVMGEMLKDLGAVNIADTDGSILENLSMEHIMAMDPEYIFLVQSGDDTEGTKARVEKFIQENPGWNSLTAVKEKKVFVMDKKLYNLKPNARWGEAYEQMEKIFQDHCK